MDLNAALVHHEVARLALPDIPVAFYDGMLDNAPAQLELSWNELCELLTSFPEPLCAAAGASSSLKECRGRDCPAKNGRAWSPVVIHDARANDNVEAVTAGVFDLDHVTDENLAKVVSVLESEGLAAIIHSTHSHSLDDQAFRLVIPFSRPCPAADYRRVRATIVAALELPADPQCKDLSRIYFLPTRRDGIEAESMILEGKALDLDDALGAEAPSPPVTPAAPSEPVSLDAVRARLAEARRSKASQASENAKEQAAILGRVLDGEPLAEPGGRDGTILRAVGVIVYWSPPNTPWEVALEVLRPSLSAMDCEPEGLDHWIEITRQKYERKALEREAWDRQREADKAAMLELAGKVKATAMPTVEEIEAEGGQWEALIILSRDGVRACEHNARLILACAPEVKGTLRYNELTKAIEVHGGPFAGVRDDVLDTAVAAWLNRHYELFAPASLVQRAILAVAMENAREPVQEYLGELAWDGSPRIDTWLETYLGARTDGPGGERYVRAIARRWLIALVARALRPGCKVDNVLILEGEQGLKKSMAFETLASQEWFLDTALELGSKDSQQAIGTVWLTELAELASFKRAEKNVVKQFVTQRVDRFRPPYGKIFITAPRRCLLVGTTNDEAYLSDRTGNRRYWPVRVTHIDVARLGADRDQLLAEAVAAFNAGERWWLEGDEVPLAAAETSERLDEDVAVTDAIQRWWYSMKPDQRPKQFTMLDVCELALKLPVERVTKLIRNEISHVMKNLGFEYKQRVLPGSRERVRYFIPSDVLLAAPMRQPTRGGNLSMVAALRQSQGAKE